MLVERGIRKYIVVEGGRAEPTRQEQHGEARIRTAGFAQFPSAGLVTSDVDEIRRAVHRAVLVSAASMFHFIVSTVFAISSLGWNRTISPPA